MFKWLDPETYRPRWPDGRPYTILHDDPFNVNEELQKQELAFERIRHSEGFVEKVEAIMMGTSNIRPVGFGIQLGNPKTR